MNHTAIEDAIRGWVLQASALPAGAVIFAHQGGVSPVPGPAATISIGDMLSVGTDELTSTFDDAAANGQEVVFEARGPRVFTCEVTFFSPDVTGDAGARAAAAATQAALRLPTVRYALNQAGLGVLREGPVRWVPRLDGSWLGQAMLEVQFAVMQSATERTGYIETVVADFPIGPVFDLKTWQMETIQRGSFPQALSDGYRFSRAGAIAGGTGTQAVNVSGLIAREVERWPSLLNQNTTLSVWFRRSPVIAVSGVSTLNDRLFFLTAAKSRQDTPPTYLALNWGLTFRPLTNDLRFTTESPLNDSTSGVSSRVTSFIYDLPIDEWTHLAIVNADNGSRNSFVHGSTMTWFLNGVQVQQNVGDGLSGPIVSRFTLQDLPTASFGVGARLDRHNVVDGCEGSIRGVAVHSRALSAAEVATLYASGPFGLRV